MTPITTVRVAAITLITVGVVATIRIDVTRVAALEAGWLAAKHNDGPRTESQGQAISIK
jgi:hypothetical protein